jgi:hypothetical protein
VLGLLAKSVAVAALAMTGAASAAHHHQAGVKLSLVPLQKAQLGHAGASLTLNAYSGPTGGIGGGFRGGFALDYGFAYSGAPGVTEIETSVGRYRKAGEARRALAQARKGDGQAPDLSAAGVDLSATAVHVPKIGGRRFAFLVSIGTAGVPTVYELDEEFTDGAYVLGARVAADSAAAAKRLAPVLARKLDKRLRLMLAGRLHGKPPKLPPPPQEGPPKNGTDPATLILTAGDFGTATVQDQGYAPVGPGTLSEYEIDWQPAGQYDSALQIVDWCGNANEAMWNSAIYVAVFTELIQELPGASSQITPVDLTAIGDGARGVIAEVTPSSGPAEWLALIGLSNGQASDFVLAESQSQIQASDVQSLAQAAANRLNAGLGD